MSARVRASIVVIGDEILDGHTIDTNSGWLAGRLSAIGVPLDRIVTVPDHVEAIGEALDSELSRERPRLVMSSGGIGSTPDDLTIEAVASYLGVGVGHDPQLDTHISRWAEQSRAEGVPLSDEQEHALRKMARVPDGAYLLGGGEGVLPGIALDLSGGVTAGGATIVILPGVPSEFRRIASDGVIDLLEGLGEPEHVAELTHPYPESALTPLLDQLVVAFPELRVGSYPGRECLIRIKGSPEQVELAMEQVRSELDALGRAAGADRLSRRWQAQWE